MKKVVKILSIIIFALALVCVFNGKVDAKSYSIKDMDIQATINKDGSIRVEHLLTYKFNGAYNGIYINIPYNLEDTTFEEIGEKSNIDDRFYNGDGVIVNKVSLVNDGGEEKEFAKIDSRYAYNGLKNIYTQTNETGISQIKVYSPSEDITKTFKLDYTINNLCVKHNDIGELYYNFIGGNWEVAIEKLNIDIYLPENKQEINIWGHGPYNRSIKNYR